MRKLYSRVLPVPKIDWVSVDLRRWYYVWINDIKCEWWACENEIDELKNRYGEDIRFELIPIRKTALR